ncbi:MAG: PIG-L family deacetylase [Verrucomicrobiae bacterium]|nr:PIG-L family deacetylase [Verrucomicrobiae bacterium]
MKLPSSLLFVGAHCDDIELIAGGLLNLACRTKLRVGLLVFSDHRGVLSKARANQARREMLTNINWLRETTSAQIVDHTTLLMPACQGIFEQKRSTIYSTLEALRDHYDLIITHPITDTNQDHVQVAAEAARVFKAHKSLLAGEFPNNDLGKSPPDVYVPLAEQDVLAKIRLVTSYRSQVLDGRPYLDGNVVRALACVRGSQIRHAHAEAFSVLGRILVR